MEILYYTLYVLFILLDIFLVFLGIYAGFITFDMRPRFVRDPRKYTRQPSARPQAGFSAKEAWQKIKAHAEAGTVEKLRLAIIEADGLVDNILKQRGYAGDTFADRLAAFNPHTTLSLNRLWDAHRMRNDIVHTHGFHVSPDTARRALDSYEAFLKEISAL